MCQALCLVLEIQRRKGRQVSTLVGLQYGGQEGGPEICKTTAQISFSVLVVTGALKAKGGKLEQCGEDSF